MFNLYNVYRKAIQNPKWRWIIVGLTAIYIISPIDIIPDFFPFLGWIDDSILLSIVATELGRLALQRKPQDKPDDQEEPGTNQKGRTVDAEYKANH